MRVTNTYTLGPDPDIDGLTVGAGPEDFTLSARGEKGSRKFSQLRFSCRNRAALLTALYQAVASATALGNANLAYKLLGCVAWIDEPLGGGGAGSFGDRARVQEEATSASTDALSLMGPEDRTGCQCASVSCCSAARAPRCVQDAGAVPRQQVERARQLLAGRDAAADGV